MLTRKLLNNGLVVVKLKSSLRKFYGHHHDLVDRYGVSVSHMTMDMFCLCNHNPVFSSFMTYHRVCNKCNTTGVACGAGTAYPHTNTTPLTFLAWYRIDAPITPIQRRSLFWLGTKSMHLTHQYNSAHFSGLEQNRCT